MPPPPRQRHLLLLIYHLSRASNPVTIYVFPFLLSLLSLCLFLHLYLSPLIFRLRHRMLTPPSQSPLTGSESWFHCCGTASFSSTFWYSIPPFLCSSSSNPLRLSFVCCQDILFSSFPSSLPWANYFATVRTLDTIPLFAVTARCSSYTLAHFHARRFVDL